MTNATIVCDSIGPAGIRLTTMSLKYPRIVHSELMTHRVFSRSSSSSRAIPVSKEIKLIEENPYIPEIFYKNIKGMQGGEPLSESDQIFAKLIWTNSKDKAIEQAKKLNNLNIHKQHVNRILEPYSYISVVVTSNLWANFFGLRYNKDADPEIQKLAVAMYNSYIASKPQFLESGQWHLPYINFIDSSETLKNMALGIQLKCSSARVARTSYLNHEGKIPTIEEDLALYERLMSGENVHASPTEHQAMAIGDPNVKSGNFNGWIQYRKTIKNENIKKFREVEE